MMQPVLLHPGMVFARDYRVLREIGSGGMGAVYSAEQISTGKHRALKVMHPALAVDARGREKFLQEARVSSQIDSDHVIDVIGAGIDEPTGAPWIAMELLRGRDLGALVPPGGRLPAAEVLAIFRQLGHALRAAHRAGIVHRDIKPENIFVAVPRREGTEFFVKVLDFGIAKLVPQDRSAATATTAMGSPLWMAPEQADTTGKISTATDVWPLALIAFWLLTGRMFWVSANQETVTLPALLREILFEPIGSALRRAESFGQGAHLPQGFDPWFARCVERDPARRFRDAGQAIDALGPLLDRTFVAQPEERSSRTSLVAPTMALPPGWKPPVPR